MMKYDVNLCISKLPIVDIIGDDYYTATLALLFIIKIFKPCNRNIYISEYCYRIDILFKILAYP